MTEETIFAAALEKSTPIVRAAYLDTACAGDTVLRQRIETLLKSHAADGNFLGKPAIQCAAEELTGLADAQATQAETPVEDADPESLDFLTPSDKPGALGRLGHYEVLEVIGRGGMGIVLRAVDEKLQRVVAIKVMAAQLATNANARKRFSREAQAAAAVTHDHIVTIHAVEEGNGLPYLVMQFVSGMSLQQRLDRSGPLELREIVRIGMQTAAGLAAAHAHGLIHRDIKPANILLENGVERVKITDFGLARAVADASLTQSGVVAGTPQYMSPEQARGVAVDQRTDLFSLGSVLYAMCTGRPPFRADSNMAVLKRVCDDTPSAIRETNPEIPDWLDAIVTKLHAKKSAERFQSAVEVAELLKEHLAYLQHPSVIGPVARNLIVPSGSETRREGSPGRRRWAMTAVVSLLCLIGGLGFTEATGVTSLRATVIRIFTPDGTLVVEVDDPGVKVTIEGDGGIVITGAGLQEVRLKPGSYKVQAAKDGKPVRLDQELVTITRGDKQVVRVRLEGEAVAAKIAPKGETGAFALLTAKGITVRKFDTLADAVQVASDGDTIEVRGNGPFVSDPIKIKLPLTIRAGDGFWPVIKLSPEGLQAYAPLLNNDAGLVLEGLELQCMAQDWKEGEPWRALLTNSKDLHVANCRFLGGKDVNFIDTHSPVVELRNCEFLCQDTERGQTFGWTVNQVGQRLVLDNCLLAPSASVHFSRFNTAGAFVQLNRNTFRTTPAAFRVSQEFDKVPSPRDLDRQVKLLRIETSGNIFDASSTFCFEQGPPDKILPPREAETHVAHTFSWEGERNLYAVGSALISFDTTGKGSVEPATPVKNLVDWRRFWPTAEANSIEGRVRYQGGDLLAKLESAPEQLTPKDWRLRPDSAGYKAGKDGKDLGADIDLVGPGKAYERWKKTPEYQQWLTDTKQTKVDPPTGERQAFVLLGDEGVEVSKFDTLAEAVQSAGDGDSIEVRGNGPFVSGPIAIGPKALVIRAAPGFHPVIKLDRGAAELDASLISDRPLVLEGLELHDISEKAADIIWSRGVPLHVANCRFITKHKPGIFCEGPCEVRNCEFASASFPPLIWNLENGAQLIVDNNVMVMGPGGPTLPFNLRERDIHDVSIQLRRNTITGETPFGSGSWKRLPNVPPPGADQARKSIQVETSENILDGRDGFFSFSQAEEALKDGKPLEPHEVEAWLLGLFDWRDQQNVYSGPVRGMTMDLPLPSLKSLADWQRFWKTGEADAIEGRVKFQGGDLIAKAALTPEQITAEDFRLRPDSAGYRAGKDGNDLGADIDLVGPGKAYERWQKTPAYQQWLKETGQTK